MRQIIFSSLIAVVLAGCASSGMAPVETRGAPARSSDGARVSAPSASDPVATTTAYRAPTQISGATGTASSSDSDSPDSDSPVGYLLARADEAEQGGDYARAAAALERAVRIEADDARLWLRLAELRLADGQPRLAESLAIKSISVAGHDRNLQADSWELISRARKQIGDSGGAREAYTRYIELK